MVESLVVDEWIYDTLTADATLQGLLAVDNRAPSYQQGIYLYLAPEKDRSVFDSHRFHTSSCVTLTLARMTRHRCVVAA